MGHLTTDELVDLAEGTRAPATAPHLGACDSCRRQLAELTAALSATAHFDVPEPSPLFWDHLSARVRDAVAAEGPGTRRSWFGSSWPRVLIPLAGGAVVAAAMVVVMTVRQPADVRSLGGPGVVAATAARDVLVDDPSLSLISDLTGDMDLDVAHEAGLVAYGSAEHAITHLNDEDLRELQRILQSELRRPGA